MRWKTPLTIGSGAAMLTVFCAIQLGACSGTRPRGIGVHNGQLAPCPSSPNCVSSFAPKTDKEHYITPITKGVPTAKSVSLLLEVIADMSRTHVVTRSPNYLHIEFKSRFFRFIDDVEFFTVDDEDVIHVRSASRKGKGDLGVNRRRIESVRRAYQKVL